MASFGEELKRERELRDISLKEISEATKISIRFLEALEHNNFEILPGGIFNRGFIRSYARFIGIDGEEMVNAYLHEISAREARLPQPGAAGVPTPVETPGVFRPEARKAARPEPRLESRASNPARASIPPETRFPAIALENPAIGGGRVSLTLWVLLVLVLVATATLLTMSLTGGTAGGTAEDSHDQAVKARLARKAPAPAAASIGSTPEIPSPPGPEEESAGTGIEAPSVPATAARGPDPSPSTSDPEPEPPLRHGLWIRASESTRVVVECSGKVVLDQELWPGQSKVLACVEPVAMSAANAGAVEYALDGRAPTLLGAVGQEIEGLILAPIPTPARPEGPVQKTAAPVKDANAAD
ncbi:MAG TPA: RodZ domain-containing protein [Candidatus Polarisedimenticolia bacterium]|jgi:hypothetical protein